MKSLIRKYAEYEKKVLAERKKKNKLSKDFEKAVRDANPQFKKKLKKKKFSGKRYLRATGSGLPPKYIA